MIPWRDWFSCRLNPTCFVLQYWELNALTMDAKKRDSTVLAQLAVTVSNTLYSQRVANY